MVARLTPDQKAACSSHVGVNAIIFVNYYGDDKKVSLPCQHIFCAAVTRIRTWVASATTKSTNHYTITAIGNVIRKVSL